MNLLDIIRKKIREFGPISIADYMELALAHPEHGYYMKRDPFGVQGDFTTAPEISQIFGELIGLWLVQQWQHMGRPEAALVELGPGRGTLMNDILRATKPIAGFHDAISIHLVEMSPVLKEKQWKTLAGKHEDLNWHDTLNDLPEKPLLLVANEFFDALPIRQFVEGKERCIALNEQNQLHFVTCDSTCHPELAEGSRPFDFPLRQGFGGQAAQGDTIIYETCEPATAITKQLSNHIKTHGGVALIIDYGYEGGSRGDTLQALKSHQYHEVLSEPGNADITAHVDFDALKNAAITTGMMAHGPIPQGALLMRLGAGERLQSLCQNASETQGKDLIAGLERLASPEQMGDLFKALCITGANHPKPEGF